MQGYTAKCFLPPLPKGYQIYDSCLNVAGMHYRKEQALLFANGYNQSLDLEREPNNEHDQNAIKLIGVCPSYRHFLGYIPRETSKQIVATNLFDVIRPRLARIYLGSGGYLEIQYQLIGPRAQKRIFDAYREELPADKLQREFYKFFNLAIPKGLTKGAARKAIYEHEKSISGEELKEWEGFNRIIEDFEDKGLRDTYGIKAVSKSILLEALNQLKRNGATYHCLSEDMQQIVDEILKIRPTLAKPW